ncbi:hypothetical protein [Streptomyces sp. NPDC000405]|uniref:hypothetical protein n=1 Tax=Streptomyces sp. NPDC000405 TaxID=3161033 RepID=UPI00398D0639
MGIRMYITDPEHRSVPVRLLHEWRAALDGHHGSLPPEEVRALRWPGTWLDRQMRLAHLLTQLTADSSWGEEDSIPFADIDTATYLWGHQ